MLTWLKRILALTIFLHRATETFAEAFFQAVLQYARERSLLSDDHFALDGSVGEFEELSEAQSKSGFELYRRKEVATVVLRYYLLRAYVAEHIQLLLVVSSHACFLPGCAVKTR
jgi:hypothetical protein